jgi:hypothetical protein
MRLLAQPLVNAFLRLLHVVQDVLDALPLAGAFWLTLLIHEAGHRQVAHWRLLGCLWAWMLWLDL